MKMLSVEGWRVATGSRVRFVGGVRSGRRRVRTGAFAGLFVCSSLVFVTAVPTAGFADENATVRASHGDPYAACVPANPADKNYPGAEVEPYIAVDPRHASKVVAVFQQDRFASGGARGDVAAWSSDGGKTFKDSVLPFSRCAPGGLAYDVASDPWVSIGPDGIVYAVGLGVSQVTPNPTSAIVGAASRNGGKTWSSGRNINVKTNSTQFFNDKPSVTADPRRNHRAYAVWDQTNTPNPNQPNQFTQPTLLSITNDGGRTWSTPKVIVATPTRAITIGNVILADSRSGRLYDLYERTVFDAHGNVTATDYDVVRSDDHGSTWSTPMKVADDTAILDTDPNTHAPLRTAAGVQGSGVIDPKTGTVYVVWEAASFSAGKYNEVAISSSENGGRTWSAPQRVNHRSGRAAFNPSIAINAQGILGVSYLDFRTLKPGNTTSLPTGAWLTTRSPGDDEFTNETPLVAHAFDMLQAPNSNGFFLGDYFGMVARGNTFLPCFAAVNNGNATNPTDILVGHASINDQSQQQTGAVTRRSQPAPWLTVQRRARQQARRRSW
jgi:hypothetical protein